MAASQNPDAAGAATPGPQQQSAASAPSPNGSGSDEKPRLTESEKKQNHIASEQKRRLAIRYGFDRLTELVPGIEGMARSEGLVLARTTDHIYQTMARREELKNAIEARGGNVVDHFPPGPGFAAWKAGRGAAVDDDSGGYEDDG